MNINVCDFGFSVEEDFIGLELKSRRGHSLSKFNSCDLFVPRSLVYEILTEDLSYKNMRMA